MNCSPVPMERADSGQPELDVLLLEDNPHDAELLLRALREAGFVVSSRRVETAEAFVQALETLPDLVISDYSMPRFSALAALEIVAEKSIDLPFILVSGAIGEEIAVEALKKGADDYLLKDRLGRLGNSVRQALDNKRQRLRHQQATRERERALRELRERIKELNVLHQVLALTQREYLSDEQFLEKVMEIIPAAFQVPDQVAARLTIGGQVFVSGAFVDGPLRIHSTVTTPGGEQGCLEVTFRGMPADGEEKAILREKQDLLHSIAEVIQNQLERNRSRQELARNSRILANMQDAAIVTDRDGRIIFWNLAAARMFGWQADEVMGEFLWARYPESQQSIIRSNLEKALASGRWIDQHEDWHQSGSRLWVDGQMIRLEDCNGEVTGALSIWRDISTQRTAEFRLLHSEQRYRRLLESESLNRVTLDALSAHICVINDNGDILTVNEAWRRFARENGMPPITVARHWNYFEVCEAAQAQGEPGIGDLIVALRRVLSGELEEWTGEYTCHAPQQYRWFRMRIRQFRIHNTPHALIAHENISSEKQQEQRMREAMEEAERANLAKSEFLATMSHELRTPLSGILGTTEFLLQTELSEQQREFLQASQSSGEQLSRLINDVLDLSKIESGKLELVESECNLHELVNDLSLGMMPLVEKKHLTLEIDLAKELTQPVLCDADRVRQVLTNLVGNAIKFTLEGGISISVQTVSRRNRAAQLRFSVRDSGIGIPEERRHRLFKAFSQADSSASRQFGGTGLGLSICRRLVELMGGEIGLESQVGVGSVFWFTIPVQMVGGFSNVHATASPPANPTIAPPTPVRANAGRKPRILVAEDNEINQLYMKELLRLIGYDCDIAANGEAALTAFMEQRYDAILMDCQMPEMNGFEATAEIRRREANDPAIGRIPIIALTANAMQGDRERCLEAGMDEYLSKPVKNDRLRQLLGEWVKAA